jgi:hypothetical protein
VRSQRERGEVPITEQRAAVIGLVQIEDPDLASFLRAASLMPSKYRQRLPAVLADRERELIVKSQRIVSWALRIALSLLLLLSVAGSLRAQTQIPVYPSATPSACTIGELIFSALLNQLEVCGTIPNTWNSVGAAGAGVPGVFTISNACNVVYTNCLQWVDDDSTDNCGTATTAFMALINGYAGPGAVQVYIGGSGAGKAYLLKTCDLVFGTSTGPPAVSIHANATLDAGTNSSANLIQFGDGTHGFPIVSRLDGGTFVGGASLTTAGIEVKNGQGNTLLQNITWTNFGAGNATLGSCTNYAIQFDNFVYEATVSGNHWGMNDSTTGRCAFNNTGGTTGESTVIFTNNTIGGKSGAVCASVGIQDGGYYGTTSSNNIGNIAIPIRLLGSGHRVYGNQLDTEGCAANGVNAVINFGPPSGATSTVDASTIENNVAQFGSGHATNFIQKAGDTGAGSAISNWNIIGNSQSGTTSTSALLLGGNPNCGNGVVFPSFCYEYANAGLTPTYSCGATTSGWAVGTQVAACQFTSSNANLGSTAVLTAPSFAGQSTPLTLTCEVVIGTADTTSSTLPQCVLTYTDAFSNTTQTVTATPVWASGTVGCSGSATNTVGNSCKGSLAFANVKSGTTINASTINFADSGGGTHMAFDVNVSAFLNQN